MKRIITQCFVYHVLVVICAGALKRHNYILQEEEDCDASRCGAQTEYVPLDEEVMVYGGRVEGLSREPLPREDCSNGLGCELQLLPDSSVNRKQELHLNFRKFHIDVDSVWLKLDQASTTSFNDAQLIAVLTKSSEPDLYKTNVGNVLRIRLYGSGNNHNDSSYDYGFQISIKRDGASLTSISTEAEPEGRPLSPGVIAFIVIISIFVASVIIFLIVKTIILKRKMASFERKDDEPLNTIDLGQGRVENAQRANQNSYTPLPTNNGPQNNLGRQSSMEATYVMTDFPYANTPMVVWKPPESSEPPPPAYEEAVRFSD
ncbi:uncharacterized protein LOC111106801 isoform X2 [Crassostrea virginica]